ncbi:MAG: hypothetical protein IIU35_02545, partial [Neisseriaceae bacterium]|nr:hypothetical protein [Neisseriaceae bacterium]
SALCIKGFRQPEKRLFNHFTERKRMKTAKKTHRKQKVELNTQMNEIRSQVSSNWHDMKTKLDKVLSATDEKAVKNSSRR